MHPPLFDKVWTVLLNAANQSRVIEVQLPNGDPRYELEAMLGGNSAAGNVLILEGQLSLAEALVRLGTSDGGIDAIMVVPPGGVGRCKSPGPRVMTILCDTAVPAGQNVIVTLRLRQVS